MVFFLHRQLQLRTKLPNNHLALSLKYTLTTTGHRRLTQKRKGRNPPGYSALPHALSSVRERNATAPDTTKSSHGR